MAVTIVTEDGTGLSNATTYCSLNESAAFFENTGRKTEWNGYSSNDRKAALNAGAQYMDDVYRDRYLGTIQESTALTQGLLWPRENVPSDRDGSILPAAPIPKNIHRANAEFGLEYLRQGGTLYPATVADGRAIKASKVRVEGAVSKETEFDGGVSAPSRRKYPRAVQALRPYLTPASRTLLRA